MEEGSTGAATPVDNKTKAKKNNPSIRQHTGKNQRTPKAKVVFVPKSTLQTGRGESSTTDSSSNTDQNVTNQEALHFKHSFLPLPSLYNIKKDYHHGFATKSQNNPTQQKHLLLHLNRNNKLKLKSPTTQQLFANVVRKLQTMLVL
jgi:phosphoenolpyruvate carboxylase